MYSNAYNVYKNNSVNHASKEQLLLMLVDGAVKFSKIARQAVLDNDVKKAHENLVKTQDIFTELMVSLEQSAGEWAVGLYKVYEFIKNRLFEANISKDIKIVEETIPLIEEVRDMWYEADKIAKTQR